MGTVGDALDNAVMESFWARVQVELLEPPALAYPRRARQRPV